ncbi:MAG: hypothetical protein EAX96_16350 [Candidatus Lokiarchaeota archaeon]|nr:hypothetical protein [Candidatus Lokiarchaeota archaeon]
MTEEKKDLFSTIIDQIKEVTEKINETVKDTLDSILGKKEGEESTGISKIIQDIRSGIRDLLGLEKAEGEESFSLNKFITKVRNNLREILGMEPLSE